MKLWKATIIAAIIGAIALVAVPFIQQPSGYELVPYVIGLHINTAITEVEKKGFRADPEERPNSTVPVNIVFDQEPKANTAYSPGQFVKLFFSTGTASYPLPVGLRPGDSLLWPPEGFAVEGHILNYQSSAGYNLVVLARSISGGPYWVQDRPDVNPDGSWVAKVNFGRDQFKTEKQIVLLLILTKQQLSPGQVITSLPEDSIRSYELTLILLQ